MFFPFGRADDLFAQGTAMTPASFATREVLNQSPAAAFDIVTPDHAKPFAETRLASTHLNMSGAVDLDSADICTLLERDLP